MKPAELVTLLDYTALATERVLEAAAHATAEQFTAAPAAHAMSPQRLLVHILSAERAYRTHLETGTAADPLRPEDFPRVAVLRQAWETEQRAMRDLLATLDEPTLDRPARSRRPTGEHTDRFTPWQLLLQLVLHSAQHRSEAAALLTSYGHSPGDLDFISFLLGP